MARRRALARVSGRIQQFPAGDALALAGALDEAAIVTLASAATVAIGAAQSNTIQISGTMTITSFDAVASGVVRRLVFSAALTLTHNATKLILPGASNITTAAGDAAMFVSLGSGNWRCVGYQLASSVGGGSGGSGVLTKYFESARQDVISSSSITIAHGLGVIPKLVSAYAVCTAAIQGYVVGDVVELSPATSAAYRGNLNYPQGIEISFDQTALYIILSPGIFMISKSSPGSVAFFLDNASWKIVVRAMA